MCGRYCIADEDSPEELLQIIDELQRRLIGSGVALKARGEAFPTDTLPVIANNRDLRQTTFAMKWGYSLPGGKHFINARSETAAEKPLFRDGMLQRRCLVPAGYYYEWEKRGKERVKYAIRPRGAGMLYMAGIYRMEQSKPVFAILTRGAAPDIEFIHDRMPVILPESARNAWLDAGNSAQAVLDSATQDIEYTPI